MCRWVVTPRPRRKRAAATAAQMPTRVQRTALSPAEIAGMKNSGEYGPIPREEEVCELEVKGEVIARGRIVKKRGEYYFKVTDVHEEAEK